MIFFPAQQAGCSESALSSNTGAGGAVYATGEETIIQEDLDL